MPDIENLRVHLTMRVLALILGSAFTMTVAGTAVVVNVQRDVREIASDLATARAAGIAERQRISAEMQAADRQHSTDIVTLRQQAETQALSAARTEATLAALKSGVDRLLSILDRPGGR
jgi:hypothetical protein